jgi:hypothetical protein
VEIQGSRKKVKETENQVAKPNRRFVFFPLCYQGTSCTRRDHVDHVQVGVGWRQYLSIFGSCSVPVNLLVQQFLYRLVQVKCTGEILPVTECARSKFHRHRLPLGMPVPALQLHPSVVVEPIVSEKATRPCKMYYEVAFKATGHIVEFICFRNDHTASIVIKQLHQDSSASTVHSESRPNSFKNEEHRWATVLPRYILMDDPNFKDQAQDWHTLSTADFNANWRPMELSRLRIYVYQQSPCWLRFGIDSFCFYCCIPPHIVSESKAIGGDICTKDRQSMAERRVGPPLGGSLALASSNNSTIAGSTDLGQRVSECIVGLATARLALEERFDSLSPIPPPPPSFRITHRQGVAGVPPAPRMKIGAGLMHGGLGCPLESPDCTMAVAVPRIARCMWIEEHVGALRHRVDHIER